MGKKSIKNHAKKGMLAIVFVVFMIYILNKWMLHNQFDTSNPEIFFDQEVLEVSVAVTEEELLQGVTAFDEKDGDVTESVIIESMSNLLEGNQRVVTYVAFDNDNHVGKAERRIQYTDYTPIRFELDSPLGNVDSEASLSDILQPLHAMDCIDGDISDQIILVDAYWTTDSLGESVTTYKVQVTNSCGEVSELNLSFKMKSATSNSQVIRITLSDYLIYCKVGESPDLNSYIQSVEFGGEDVGVENVDISTELNISKAGVYVATYSASSGEAKGTCDLIIVVEE